MLLPPDAPEPQQGMIDAEAHSSLSCFGLPVLACRMQSPNEYLPSTRRVPFKYRRMSTAHAFQTIVHDQVLPRQSR
jgi:hypothetical protein